MKKRLKLIIYIMIINTVCMCACGKDNTENKGVGEIRMNVETYLAGKDQVTHPSMIAFEDEWNGYEYWMSYTPYPYANGEEENPCIAVSNDLYKWETPLYLSNPIADNEETGCDELKDSHLLYRDDLNRIEMWYLGRLSERLGGDGSTLLLFRKYSYDGITWSDYEIMMETKYLSPSIRWDGTKYQCWAIGFDTYETTGTFVYQESKNGIQWTAPQKCSIDTQENDLKLWHGSVEYANGNYHFTYIEDGADSQEIKYCKSEDGISFSEERTIVKNGKNTLWDRFYRPCILFTDNQVVLLYGVITENNEWYISMSKGDSVDSLEGICNEDKTKMCELKTTVTDTRTIKYVLKDIYYYMQKCVRFELASLFVVLLFAFKFADKKKFLISVFTVIFCNLYTWKLVYPTEVRHYLCIVVISTMEAMILLGCVDFLEKWKIFKH